MSKKKTPVTGQCAKVWEALKAGKKVSKKTFKIKNLSAVMNSLRKMGYKIPFAVKGAYQLKK